jgi:hypothetical protein
MATSLVDEHHLTLPTHDLHRAGGVALINTTTGDLLRHVKLLALPSRFAAAR